MDNILLEREIMFKEVAEKLVSTIKVIDILNSTNLYDINQFAEDFVGDLLNLVFNWELTNANVIKSNFPAIDLIDDKKMICVQVTSTNAREKIQNTIDKFIDHKLFKKYKTLYLFILTNKKAYRKKFDVDGKLDFSIEKNILDFNDLINKIEMLNISKLKLVHNYLFKTYEKINQKQLLLETEKLINEDITSEFIKRKWLNKEQYMDLYYKYYHKETFLTPLEVFENNNYIVLLGEAGYGKSEEAKNLMNSINRNCDYYFAFFYDLSNYCGDEIISLLPLEYENLPKSNLVFVLDGYDEISGKNNSKLFRKKIENFKLKAPSTKVIVTCRINQYDFDSETVSGTLNGFNEYFIEPLRREHINKYLSRKNLDSTVFWRYISKNSLNSLTNNIFFVKWLIELFQKNDINSPSTLVERVIDKSIKLDITRFKYKYSSKQFNSIKADYRKLAIVLELLESNSISQKNVEMIIRDQIRVIIIEESTLWKRKSDSLWGFTHKIFGEYLAAKSLNKLTLEDIKIIVTMGEDKNIINHSWLNTLLFLNEINDNHELLNWVMKTDISLLKYVEKSRLSSEKWNEIILCEYNNYINKKLWLPYEFLKLVTDNDFINKKETINALLDEIELNRHFTCISNSIKILKGIHFQVLFSNKIIIEETLMSMINSSSYRNEEKKDAIETLVYLRIIDSIKLRNIINNNKNNEDEYLRSAYYRAIYDLNIADDYLNLLINRYELVFNLANKSTLGSEHDNYQLVLSVLKKKKSIIKFLKFLQENSDNYNLSIYVIKGLIKAIRNNYLIEKDICLIYNLFIFMKRKHSTECKRVILLINDLEINTIIIDLILSNKNIKGDLYYIVDLLNRSSVEYLINWYDSDNYYKKAADIIITNIWNINALTKPLLIKHKEKTEFDRIKFLNDKKHFKNEIEKGNQFILNNIFSKKKIIKIVNDFIEEILKNETTTVRELMNLSYKERERFTGKEKSIYNFLVKYFSQESVLNKNLLNNKDWEIFILNYFYDITKANSEIELIEEQIDKLRIICMRQHLKYDNKKIYNIKTGNGIGIYWLAIYLGYFYFKYSFKYKKSFLLKLLIIDEFYLGNDYDIKKIVNHLNPYEVSMSIVENIDNSLISGNNLKNHFEYCKNNNISEVIDSAIDYLNVAETTDYNGEVGAINYLIEFKSLEWIIENIYYSTNKEIRNILDKYILETKSGYLIEEKIQILNSDIPFKEKMAAIKFITLSDSIDGLEFYLDWIKSNNKTYDDYSSRDIEYTLSKLKNPKFIDILIEYLVILQKNSVKKDFFNSTYRGVKKALENIARFSNEACAEIIKKLEQAINDNTEIYNISFLNYVIEDIKKKSFDGVEKYSIDEIVKLMDRLGLRYDN